MSHAKKVASLHTFLAVFPLISFTVAVTDPGKPESDRQIEKFITSAGYGFERHDALTDDGYMLKMFRIPNANGAAVLLQHGILDSAWTWVINDQYKPLAFCLYDAGSDVWMGNNRGNGFSQYWTNGTVGSADPKFWDFTYDEMGQYDVPAHLDAVIANTKQKKVAYIGHSRGTTQMFIAGSNPTLKSRVADRVSLFIALSPIAFLRHANVPLLNVLSSSTVANALRPFNPRGFLEKDNWRTLAKIICTASLGVVCDISVDVACGHGSMDSHSMITLYSSYFPFGTSFKDMDHFAQAVHTTYFRKYDWGSAKENQKHYGVDVPPNYDLTKFAIPTALFMGAKDVLADPDDLASLQRVVPDNALVFQRFYEEFSHLTWMLGKQEAAYYIDDVLKVLNEHSLGRAAVVV
jgi:pimeloyl-ACP methyl ester carboxylesterase